MDAFSAESAAGLYETGEIRQPFSPRFIYCEHAAISPLLPQIADLGLGVEILFESTEDLWPQARWENLLDLADAIADAGIPASVHGPFHNLNLGSKDSHIRAYSEAVLTAALEVARAVRSPHVVFHTGWLPQYPPAATARWLDVFSAGLERLLHRAAELDVRLLIENTYEPDPSLFAELFARFPSPGLGMCLDTGHAACFGRVEPLQWPRQFAARIAHVHCSDNDGRHDLHWGLGAGVVNLRGMLQPLAAAGGAVSVTLEVPASAAVASRDYLNDVVNSLRAEENS